MVGYIVTAAFFYLLSKTQRKRPSVGRLPGHKITQSELLKKIRRGEAGNVNNNDLYFDNGVLYDLNGNIYDNRADQKATIYDNYIAITTMFLIQYMN